MKAAELLIRCLEHEGVQYMFGVPGEENIDVMDALVESSIEFIVTRHETGAAFMAGVYGRLTGRPAACLATLGPGATNMVTGVANATMDHQPVIAITGQAGLNRQHKISHQHYNLTAMYEPVTKWSAQVKDPDTIPEMVRKAVRTAAGEKPGAVHLDFPEDIAKLDTDAAPLEIVESPHVMAEEHAVKRAATEIDEAAAPLILVGNGVARNKAEEELGNFVEKLNLPLVHTFMGKGALARTNQHSLLSAGVGGDDYIACAFRETDLIITIGFDIVEYPPANWNEGKTSIIHIDSLEAETDQNYPVKHQLVGDIQSNLEGLTKACQRTHTLPDWATEVREQVLNEVESARDDTSFPLKPQKICADLREALPERSHVITDVGAHKMWLARLFHTSAPDHFLISNGLASMGVALPGAVAAKMVYPNEPVVAVAGDGALQMTGCEMETVVRLGLPVIILLWRDEGYGLIEWHQLKHFERDAHVSFGNPDFLQLAEAYGFESIQITAADELTPALKKAVELNKPVFIDCPVDYKENMKLTERFEQLSCNKKED
ncbi:acetolactate synthase large subunit [Salsuginibacillus halophilus]|uniref:Acetolactate synthase large subunit n=1 Tax=Salsuginibacillus halophilus TaxID=517424 RepID=A0A2P8HYH1_9BACI|nr:acetolactate synthase large subunit [Salsuginibacillus halophilus]PSL51288.1 acetolactate synthase large subunit [Salsuginibacillus halophilus]